MTKKQSELQFELSAAAFLSLSLTGAEVHPAEEAPDAFGLFAVCCAERLVSSAKAPPRFSISLQSYPGADRVGDRSLPEAFRSARRHRSLLHAGAIPPSMSACTVRLTTSSDSPYRPMLLPLSEGRLWSNVIVYFGCRRFPPRTRCRCSSWTARSASPSARLRLPAEWAAEFSGALALLRFL